jgi:hypothetical protein
MPTWKKVVVSGSIAQLANETFISGHITASGIVKAEHLFSTDDALITDDLVVGGNIDLEGDIDVNGTANLDAVDIDGNVDIAGTTAINDAMTIATNKKLIFRDSAIHISSTADGDLAIAADDEIDITSTLIDINGNVDISGTALVTGVLTTTAIQVVNGGLALATDKKVQFRDSAVYINSDADGYLEAVADTGITFKIGSTEQVLIADGKVEPTTTNDIDLGSAAKKFKNLFLTGDITASGHVNVVGDITSSAIISAEHLFSSDDAEITDNLVVGGDIDLEGAIDVNGTANLDVVDIDGAVDMASTALVTGVLTTTAIQVVNGGLAIDTNKKIQFRDAAIAIASPSDGLLNIAADDEVQIATTLVDLNGNLDVSGTALVTGVLTSTAIQVVNGGLALATDKKIQFRDSAIFINSDADANLQLVADTNIVFKIGSTDQFKLADGAILPATTNDIDLGSITKKFKNLFLTGDVTASGHMHVVGDITSSGTIKADTLAVTTFNPDNLATGNITASGYIHAVGDITSSGIFLGEGLLITDDATITDNLTVGGDIDLEGAIDVNGTANLDVVDSDGAVNMADTALVTGVLTTTAIQVVNGGLALATNKKIQFRDSAISISSTADGDMSIAADDEIDITSTLIDINGNADISGTLALGDAITVATNKKLIFRDSAIHISSTADGDLSIAADDEIDITSTLIDINGNLDVSGTALVTGVLTSTAIQVVNGGLALATDKKIQFRDSAIYINSDADGYLEAVADTGITFKIGSTEQLAIKDGAILPTTTNDIDLGSKALQFKNLFLTGDVSASGHMNIVGDITSSAIISAEHLFSSDDAEITDNLTVGGDIDLEGSIDVNGTANLDIVDIDGAVNMATTALITGVLTTSAIQVVNGGIAAATNKKVQFRDAAIYLNSSTDGQLDIVADDEVQIATTLVDLNGNLDVSGTALVTGVLTTTAIQVVNGGLALATDKKVQFRDSAIFINSDADGHLELVADTGISFKIGSTEQFILTDGALTPTTTNDVDLGSATKKFKNLFLTGDITASGHAHVVGDITASGVLKGATGNIAGALVAATLDTGQGANELYDMDQNVKTTNAVVFTTVNTGQGANELYAMDQAVKTNSDVVFADVQIDGDLVVAGTASFTNTTNLEIKDRFISLASGSTSVGDGGIVVNHFGGTYPSGSAFGYEGGTANRWAVQNEFMPTGSSMVPDAYMGIVTFSTAVPTGNPTYGGANYGYGNIHVETDTGDIFIFA